MSTPTPEPVPADNLPALATKVGGALVSVMSQMSQYTDTAVGRRTISLIARIVQENPDLNTEPRVAMLADLAGFHDEPMGVWLSEFLADNDIEVFYLAVDYLHHIGHRGPTKLISADVDRDNYSLRELMADLCDFIMELRRIEGQELDVEVLDNYIRIIGLNNVSTTDHPELLAIYQSNSIAEAALLGFHDDTDDDEFAEAAGSDDATKRGTYDLDA